MGGRRTTSVTLAGGNCDGGGTNGIGEAATAANFPAQRNGWHLKGYWKLIGQPGCCEGAARAVAGLPVTSRAGNPFDCTADPRIRKRSCDFRAATGLPKQPIWATRKEAAAAVVQGEC